LIRIGSIAVVAVAAVAAVATVAAVAVAAAATAEWLTSDVSTAHELLRKQGQSSHTSNISNRNFVNN